MTAITIAARLLRVAADELKNAHTLGGDWGNEHEALEAYNEHMATATTLEHMARQCLAQIEEPANTWPAGLLERVKSALERIENNHCTRRIPADPTDPDLVLAEVRYLLEGKTPPFWVSKLPQGAAPAAVSQRGEYPQLPEGVMFIEQVGGDVIGRPTDYGFKHGRGIVHGAELFTSEQLRAYFDLGRQPSTAAPALEAPAAPAVPLKATPEMRAAFRRAYREGSYREREIWGNRLDYALDQMLAAAPQAPAAPINPDACSKAVFENGVSIGLFDIPKDSANAICAGISSVTGACVDWHYIAGRVHIKALAAPTAAPAAPAVDAKVQWWLARLDQYGNPKLTDGAHSDRAGADQAAYLIAAMNLGPGEKYAVARVELTEPRPSADGVNQEAIALHNRAAQAAAKGDSHAAD